MVGASGTVKIIAPLPAVDTDELPYTFVAVILAKMLLPQSIEKGVAFSTEIGMVHALAYTIVKSDPLQLISSVENFERSFYLISIL